jgi:hypothetical protein
MLDTFLEDRLIVLGDAQIFGDLLIHPIKRAVGSGADFLTLDEALAAGLVDIAEISEGGSVPELKLRNRVEKPVLLLDGEELRGGKQNRALNLSILVAPESEIVIPVSCVEQGRWSRGHRGRPDERAVGGGSASELRSSEDALFASVKFEKMRHVSASMKERRAYRSDQSEIWDRIEKKARRMDSLSETGAAATIFERNRKPLEDYAGAFRFDGDEIGAVFVIRGRVSGIEIFGSTQIFAKLWPKLVRSYALDALDRLEPSVGGCTKVPDVKAVLDRLRRQKADRYRALGLGEDLRCDDGELVAAGLVHDNDLVHLSAFVPA